MKNAQAKSRRSKAASDFLFLLAALTGLSAIALALRMWRGFYLPQFGDEIEHIVGAKVIGAGGLLYRDFVDEHGPVPYALGQAFGAIAGWAHPQRIRLIPAAIATIMIACIGASPFLRGAVERLTAVATFMGLLASVWVVQGLALADYQMTAGALLVIAMTLDAAPVWSGVRAPPAAQVAAGAAYVISCFVAYSFGPAALLLLASRIVARPLSSRELRFVALGAALALLVAMAWLAVYADPLGYIAYHFILSQLYFGPYLLFQPRNALIALLPKFGPYNLVQTGGSLIALAGTLLLFAPLVPTRGARLTAAALLAAAALIWTNPRGSPNFQDAAFLVLSFALLALALGRATGNPGRRPVWLCIAMLTILASEAAARHSLSTPHGYSRKQLLRTPPEVVAVSQEPWADALRRAVRPDERILSIPFLPVIYLRADRLPMRGYYDYLPWDADYAKHPWFGLKRDLCTDFRRNPPPVVFTNDWVVWGLYDPKKYMTCVYDALRQLYVPAPYAPGFYVRRDRLAAWTGK